MTNRKTKKKPAKRTGRRETSARVARIAGRLLRLAEKGRFTVMTEERQSDGSTDVIVHGVDKEVRAQLKSRGAHFLSQAQAEQLAKLVVTPQRSLNPKIVGKPATTIAVVPVTMS